MTYKYVSIAQVIARLIRDTRLNDSGYLADLPEWIAEALGMMQMSTTLRRRYLELEVKNFKVMLPCGLQELYAVEYCGTRLPYRGSSRDPRMTTALNNDPTTGIFISGVGANESPNGNSIFVDRIEEISSFPLNQEYNYQVDINCLLFNFETGKVTLYFGEIPTDEDGYPLIPDNENLKEALKYYCRGKLIGAGYPDKVMSYEACLQLWETYYPRAINQITYPTPDEREATLATLSWINLPNDYFKQFDQI